MRDVLLPLLLLILREIFVTFFDPFLEGFDVVDVLIVLLGIDDDKLIVW